MIEQARAALRAPDIDQHLDYAGFNEHRQRGVCRVRVWLDRRVAVVTEIDENTGPSVTNCIEHVADAVGELLCNAGIDNWRYFGWQLVEHYEANRIRPATFDVVEFGSPSMNVRPHWRSAPANEFGWLREACA